MAPNTCAESSNKPESHQPVRPLRGAHSSHNTGASDSSWETRAHSQLGFFLWFKLTEGHLPNINIQSRWTGKGRPYTRVDFTYPGYRKYCAATDRWWQVHWITVLRATVYENSAVHVCKCIHEHVVGRRPKTQTWQLLPTQKHSLSPGVLYIFFLIQQHQNNLSMSKPTPHADLKASAAVCTVATAD